MSKSNDELKPFRDLITNTKIKQVMISPVVTIREHDDFSLAQIKFMDNHISHLIVVDDNDKYRGVLSQKYLYKTQSPRKIISEEMDFDPGLIIDGGSFYEKSTLDSYILRNVMNRMAYTLKPEDSLLDAVNYMAKNRVGCIPVVDTNRNILGILTNEEVVKFIAKL